MYFSVMFFFSVTKHQIVYVATVVNLVYTYLTRIQFDYDLKPLETGGAGGAIYLPNLVPHHSAWSTHKGRWTLQGLGA